MLWLTLQKLKPTIDPVKCRYIKGEEITQFHQRNENAWNALMRIGGSIYKLCTTLRGQFKGTASAIIYILYCCRPQRVHYNL